MQRTPFDIPDQMRQAADKSVEQAKQAFDQFMEATQKAVAKAEGTAKSVRAGSASGSSGATSAKPAMKPTTTSDQRELGCLHRRTSQPSRRAASSLIARSPGVDRAPAAPSRTVR